MNADSDHLLVRVLRGQTAERVPVWAMRQSGRWDPEYVALRKDSDSMSRAEWAMRASLLPRRYGVDAIVPLYDFTVMTAALGLTFVQNKDVGPMPVRPIRTQQDVANLPTEPDETHFAATADLIRAIHHELAGELPVITIADAPFTLATYCLGLSTDIGMLRIFVREHADVWALLLDRLTDVSSCFVKALVAAGTNVLQLSDSLAGKLTEDEYDRWAQRAHKAVLANIGDTPSIVYVKEGEHVEAMSASGADAVSLGSTVNLADVRRKCPELTIQGNMDVNILRNGTPLEVMHATQACLTHGGGQRHILNFNRSLPNDTKPENFAAFIATARAFRQEPRTK